MANNYLEQLAAEWYEFQGYFVRKNVLVGKRPEGGYECELDVIAFHPAKQHLVHVEPSTDADSWETRERRFRKKFNAGKKYIPALFSGFQLPQHIDHIALLLFASKKNHATLAGGEVMLVPELLAQIFRALKGRRVAASAIPEHLPILRSFQLVTEFRASILPIWRPSSQKS